MKKILLFILLLMVNEWIYSQTFKLGILGHFLTGNKYLDYKIGPALVLDYNFKNVPLSVQGNTRFYLGKLSNENIFSTGFTYNVYSIGSQINYYPITWTIEPYIGVGIFYNFNNIQESGTPAPLSDGTIYSPSHIKNNFSGEITGGIKFSAHINVNFIIEVSQTFNKPE